MAVNKKTKEKNKMLLKNVLLLNDAEEAYILDENIEIYIYRKEYAERNLNSIQLMTVYYDLSDFCGVSRELLIKS